MLPLPFFLAMGSIVVLLLASGLATKGVWFGVLIDDRNRISLSRTQQVAWTILLLAALSIMGWFNAAVGAVASPTAASILPTIPGALWAALGVNLVATPYLSDLILDKKDPGRQPSQGAAAPDAVASKQQPGGFLGVASIIRPARLDENQNPQQASWIDLVTGETSNTDQQLDVSRIQHLVISGALLTTYFTALASQLGDIAGIIGRITTGVGAFAAMPPVDPTTFVGLLGLSHAGYLVFKANAPEGEPPAGGGKTAT
jgi:hypothetical protein